MKNEPIIAMALLMIAMLAIFPTGLSADIISSNSAEDYPYNITDKVISNALSYLRNKQSREGSIGSFSVSAWAAMAIASTGDDLSKWGELVNYLEKNVHLLDSQKATDWERHTLAIVACGKNPRNFAGIDFVEKIKGFYDGEQIGDPTNLYDDFFGILALISCGEKQEENIIKTIKTYIKNHCMNDKGWGDVDATSAAIMALIAGGESPNSSIIRGALSFIKSLQTEDGGFISWGVANTASTAWAVQAIVAAGEDPTSDYWKKNGKSPIDFLINLQQSDGSFAWSVNQNINPEWMTSYAIPALVGKPYPVKIYGDEDGEIDTWTGRIRIEGKNETIWDGIVTTSDVHFFAKNVDTGKLEEYHIPYPTVLGALIDASNIAGFHYFIEYWPKWDAFYVKTIDGDSDWWHYWVDYDLPMIGADDYKLTDKDSIVLWGYVESWEVGALKILVDKHEVKKNEKFIVSVLNESDVGVEGAIVHVDQERYITDKNGNVTISIAETGTFKIFAEKEGFVRSEKVSIKVKKSAMITKPVDNGFYLWNFKLFSGLKKTLIIGPIDIEVEVSEEIKKVDFYINGELVFSDNELPFKYRLNEKAFFKKFEIMVKSYSIEVLSYRGLTNNTIKLLEKLRVICDRYGIKTNFDLSESYFSNSGKTVFKEEDTDHKEVIVINLFTNLYK